MTSSETRLHSGEGTVGFELVGDLFVNLAFEDLRNAGIAMVAKINGLPSIFIHDPKHDWM
jgi:hypothetical protein